VSQRATWRDGECHAAPTRATGSVEYLFYIQIVKSLVQQPALLVLQPTVHTVYARPAAYPACPSAFTAYPADYPACPEACSICPPTNPDCPAAYMLVLQPTLLILQPMPHFVQPVLFVQRPILIVLLPILLILQPVYSSSDLS